MLKDGHMTEIRNFTILTMLVEIAQVLYHNVY